MRLVDKSVFSELLTPFFIGLLAFLMMLVGNTLFTLLDRMMQEGWPLAYVARVLLYNIPQVLVLTLPIAGVVGASLAASRLARDGEITALRSMGLSLRRIFVPVVALGMLLTIADYAVFDRVVPWAWREQSSVQDLLANLPQNPIESAAVVSVENYTICSSSYPKKLKDRPGTLRIDNVTILERPQNRAELPRIGLAEWGEYTKGKFIFYHGSLQELNPDGTTRLTTQFETQEIAISLDRALGGLSVEQMENLSSAELRLGEAQMTKLGDKKRALEYAIARWYKIGLPALCLPLALFAVPLALRFSKAGSFAGLLLSLVIVFLAVSSLAGAKAVARAGFLPTPLALVLPAILFLATALLLLRRLE
jgi:lipopolysaccharide export system permease protein